MTRPDTGALDRCRLVCALLVVANHTSPLLSLSPFADHLLTQVWARLAVPFFLMLTGRFLLPRLRREGRAALLPFLRSTALLYAAATLLYLPLQLYKGYRPGFFPLLQDVFFGGTFYHLWYFPALLLGVALLYALRRLKAPVLLALCAGLYLVGLLGDSYFGLISGAPPLAAAYGAVFSLVEQTRNGPFLAPLFLLLGFLSAETPPRSTRKGYGAAFFLSLALLTAEGAAVSLFAKPEHSVFYLALPLCAWFLFRWLCAMDLPQSPRLRALSAVVYLIHPWCIVLVRGLAKLTGSVPVLVACSPVHFLAVAALSLLLGSAAVLLPRRTRPLPRSEAPLPPARCWAEIDLSALRHNLAFLRARLPQGCTLMAVVKAGAYGHGAGRVAAVCAGEGVDAFAVATVAEGSALRRSGITGDILVLGRAFPEELRDACAHDLILTVADALHARELAAFPHPLRVHAALDTGMCRLGFPFTSIDDVASLYGSLRVEGLFTHLCAVNDTAFTELQLARFFSFADALRRRGLGPGRLHVQSSAGLLGLPPLPVDYVRPGLALYGCGWEGLRPVLSLKCRIAAVHTLAPGETAGYGRAFTALRPTVLAVLSAGYADGLPRALSCGRGGALLCGQYAPTAGLICMDQTLVDVTELPQVRPGDTAVLIGPGLDAETVAAAAGTIPNELLSRLGPRVERVYLGS